MWDSAPVQRPVVARRRRPARAVPRISGWPVAVGGSASRRGGSSGDSLSGSSGVETIVFVAGSDCPVVAVAVGLAAGLAFGWGLGVVDGVDVAVGVEVAVG